MLRILLALLIFASPVCAGNIASLGGNPPSGGPLFSDTFSGTSGTVLSSYSANWTGDGTTAEFKIAVNNTTIIGTAAGAYDRLASNPAGSADYQVELYITTSNTTGVCARSTDNSNWYCIQKNTDTSLRLRKNVAGTVSTVGSTATVPSGAGTIKISVKGTTIKGYFNGTEYISQTDSAISAAGYPAIQVSSAMGGMDNFAVYVAP